MTGVPSRGRTRALTVLAAVVGVLLALLPTAAAPAQAVSGPGFTAISPVRAVDTRDGTGAPAGRVPWGAVLRVQLAGRLGVPADAAAVALNVTVTAPTMPGYLTVWPCGRNQPMASNLNFVAGQTVPNAVVIGIGADGLVCVRATAPLHLIIDVNGWWPPDGGFTAMTPVRAADTRNHDTAVPEGVVAGGRVLQVPVAERFGIPWGVDAVALNVTVTGPRGPGYVTVWPCGQARPLASNLNFVAGQTVPNAALSKVGSSGSVCLYTSAATHLIVDVAGWFSAGSGFTGITPARAADTRNGSGVRGGMVPAGQVLQVPVGGRFGIPTGAGAAALNVTVTGPTAGGYVTAYPCGQPRPLASNLNFAAGQTLPNAVLVKLGAAGAVCLYTSATTHVLVDVAGWFRPGEADDLAPGPVSGLSVTTRSATALALSWTNPGDRDLAQVIVRRSVGTTAPASPTEGAEVPLQSTAPASTIDVGLAPATAYAYAVFTTDMAGNMRSAGTWASGRTAAGPALPLAIRNETITAGSSHTCALDSGGRAWCWGTDGRGELGQVPFVQGAVVTRPSAVTGGRVYTSITAGRTHTCALDTAGKAWCWGAGDLLGNAGAPFASAPVAVAGDRAYTSITAGDSHTCALDAAGKAWCWGSDAQGQLGDGGTGPASTTTPLAVAGEHAWSTLSAGSSHTCGLDTAGQAWCWGDDARGQVGDGGGDGEPPEDAPVAVSQGGTWATISSGGTHTCTLDTAGKAWCWGSDWNGQIGDGGTRWDAGNCEAGPSWWMRCAFSPVPVADDRTYATISAGDAHTCAVGADWTAWCWGANHDGQTGDGSAWPDDIKTAPVAVAGGRGWTTITSGSHHTCGVDTAGRAWCWGTPYDGRLGDGDVSNRIGRLAMVAGDRGYRSP
jgi:alpha-tubulin suppressor-like RCC1 family protein